MLKMLISLECNIEEPKRVTIKRISLRAVDSRVEYRTSVQHPRRFKRLRSVYVPIPRLTLPLIFPCASVFPRSGLNGAGNANQGYSREFGNGKHRCTRNEIVQDMVLVFNIHRFRLLQQPGCHTDAR